MKKTLATLLVVALVASLCGVMFVSAESVNLAAGKEVANAENVAADVTTLWIDTDLTDGKAETGWEILWTAGQWFGYWWNPDSASAAEWTNAPEGVATPTIDLGAVCSVDKVRVNMFLGSDMGIIPAQSVTVKVSTDGENYTDVATTTLDAPAAGDTTVGWVEFALEAPVDAQYVCVEMVLGAVWLFVDEIEIYGTAPAGSDEPVEPDAPAEPEMFWLTHYNDGFVEGSGVIFTEEDTAGGWWLHVAFAPIAGAENAYEIVEITNGLADGSAAKVAVPEGGFVWASNYGNDYISLGMGDTDFTSPNCTDAINRATAWQVGDQFVISGVDFETIPTTTADVNWYDDAYVCTATIAPYVPGSAPETPDTPITGDAGILVFAVLAVVAIAGCAVASKIKSSAL